MKSSRRKAVEAALGSSESHVFSQTGLLAYLDEHRMELGFSAKTSTRRIVESMVRSKLVKELKCKCPGKPTITRYALPKSNRYEIALSLRPRSFLSHGTAVFVHSLTSTEPDVVVVNCEQTPKPKGNQPTQDSIDAAFARPQRRSTSLYSDGENRFLLINGKHTGRLGVVVLRTDFSQALQVTSLERTLIDITVRPGYADGAALVLEAYRRAKGRVDIQGLTQLLTDMDFTYPYHQVVGFYLSRAGYSDAEIAVCRSSDLKFDFYLEHGMKAKAYDPSWRVYFPKQMGS